MKKQWNADEKLKFARALPQQGARYIAGVDEVGRGPLAGPVVCAAVIMPLDENSLVEGVDDSKKLSAKKREQLAEEIKKRALCYTIVEIDEKTIDEINILEATKLGMKRAIKELERTPDVVLTDGNMTIDISYKQHSVIHGDALSYSIGAAPCILAAAGLAVGLLWKYSKAAALLSGCAAALTLGAAMDGFAVLPRMLPDAICTAAIFLPLTYYEILPRLPVFVQPEADRFGEEAMILEKQQNDTVLRMTALSEALERLSGMIYTLSDRLRRPGILDLKQVCDNAFDSHCTKCSLQTLCWDRECTSTLDAQSRITTELYKKGRAELADIPDYLRARCSNIEKIAAEINVGSAALVERLIKSDKTEAFAIDYEALSKLLAGSVAGNEAEYRVDEEMTKKLRRSLKYMDMPASRALCYGSRRKQIIIGGVELARVRMGAEEIRRAIENTLRTRMNKPRFHIEDETVTMTRTARRRFAVEQAKATSIRESESANGDTAAMFETREDYYYALISDGMGSGREAAITSKLCAIFCEQMLAGGNDKAVTLEMLNGFIRSRGSECSATIDMAEIDMITGEACFVKSGAAPSYVLRAGNLYKIQSKTVPIGILPELDAEKIRFELQEGDVIVMLSDGVAQSLEDGVWLANLLSYEWVEDLQLMAEKILDNAALNNARSDDMTVALVRVTENTEAD